MTLEEFYNGIDDLAKKREVDGVIIIMPTKTSPLVYASMPPEQQKAAELWEVALHLCMTKAERIDVIQRIQRDALTSNAAVVGVDEKRLDDALADATGMIARHFKVNDLGKEALWVHAQLVALTEALGVDATPTVPSAPGDVVVPCEFTREMTEAAYRAFYKHKDAFPLEAAYKAAIAARPQGTRGV
jgi:hypothetical protein